VKFIPSHVQYLSKSNSETALKSVNTVVITDKSNLAPFLWLTVYYNSHKTCAYVDYLRRLDSNDWQYNNCHYSQSLNFLGST